MAGNIASLEINGFFTLRFQLAGHVLLNEFEDVWDLSVDRIIADEKLAIVKHNQLSADGTV